MTTLNQAQKDIWNRLFAPSKGGKASKPAGTIHKVLNFKTNVYDVFEVQAGGTWKRIAQEPGPGGVTAPKPNPIAKGGVAGLGSKPILVMTGPGFKRDPGDRDGPMFTPALAAQYGQRWVEPMSPEGRANIAEFVKQNPQWGPVLNKAQGMDKLAKLAALNAEVIFRKAVAYAKVHKLPIPRKPDEDTWKKAAIAVAAVALFAAAPFIVPVVAPVITAAVPAGTLTTGGVVKALAPIALKAVASAASSKSAAGTAAAVVAPPPQITDPHRFAALPPAQQDAALKALSPQEILGLYAQLEYLNQAGMSGLGSVFSELLSKVAPYVSAIAPVASTLPGVGDYVAKALAAVNQAAAYQTAARAAAAANQPAPALMPFVQAAVQQPAPLVPSSLYPPAPVTAQGAPSNVAMLALVGLVALFALRK